MTPNRLYNWTRYGKRRKPGQSAAHWRELER